MHPPDDLVSVTDPEVDVAAVQAEIRAAAAEKRRSGVYTEEFLAALDEPLDVDPDPRFAGGLRWGEAEATWEVFHDTPLVSTRRVVGPVIVAAKRVVRRALRWYIWPITDRVSVHNRAIVDVLAEHNRQIGRLRMENDALRRRVDELEREADERP